jgi:hypothetical protein
MFLELGLMCDNVLCDFEAGGMYLIEQVMLGFEDAFTCGFPWMVVIMLWMNHQSTLVIPAQQQNSCGGPL